ncbi:MAG: transporter substrate-binding domain-containing protein [Trueperaceae bacterium]
MRAWRSWWAPFATIAALLAAVYTLPPDTTMAQVRESGVLRVCVPESLPPLVTSDVAHPGIDVEILDAVADRADLRLQLVRNRAIGRDFDPRNWRVTRAQCLVIAGGVVATPATRAFLDTTTPHLETGWAAVAIDPDARLTGGQVGVHVPVAGLDRLALSSYLREHGATVSIVQRMDDLALGLRAGTYDVVVTDALTAREVAADLGEDAAAMWLPSRLERFPIAFGLWKGDLTLRRAIERELRGLEREGEIDRIVAAYELASLSDTCWVCGDSPETSSEVPP